MKARREWRSRWLKPWLMQDQGSYWCLACQVDKPDRRGRGRIWIAAIRIKRVSRKKLSRWLRCHMRCGLHEWRGIGL